MYWVTDERYGSNSNWRDYPPICSATLNQAFRDGKTTVRITLNEKPVLVDFVEMSHRFIDSTAQSTPVYGKAKLVDDFEMQKILESEKTLQLNQPHHEMLVKNIIALLRSRPNDSPPSMEHLFSALSLLLNLVSGNVKTFIEVNFYLLIVLKNLNWRDIFCS